jgi:RecJ-like exonuclease
MKDKFTKKQKEAISYLQYDLNELDNKPRRLFSSLIKFAEEFVDDKEYLNEVKDSIQEFEVHYYSFLQTSDLASDIIKTNRKVKRELLSNKEMIEFEKQKYSEDMVYGYEKGVKSACHLFSKKILDEIIEIEQYN